MAIALITGASRGIGLATVMALARANYRVIAMRTLASADELLSLVAAERLSVSTLTLDGDDDVLVVRGVEEALTEHGHIDVL
jgi:NAD(P)-dependent dehydrogenase (short-subunit alcohol dehydrogenase family)